MDGLQIQIEELTNTANRIRKENQQQQECLQRIHQQMQHITKDWQSPSAQAIYDQFKKLLPTFKSYEEIIEQYAQFLNATVLSYQEMEKQLEAYANMFG